MAKIIIPFNNKDYSIDESALSEASAALKSHLSTVMNGSGATVNFNGVSYNIDSTKLSAATNAFISHLGTVSGNGYKVKVGGVEYGVDSTKMTGAVSELEVVLGGLKSNDEDIEDINPMVFSIYREGDYIYIPMCDTPFGGTTIEEARQTAIEILPSLLGYATWEELLECECASSEEEAWELFGLTEETFVPATQLFGWSVMINLKKTDKLQETYGSILESVHGYPVTNMGLGEFNGTFSGCTSLTTAPEIPNSVTDMTYAFYECTNLTTAPVIPNSVTNMYGTFVGCANLTTAPEIPAGVTNMKTTFEGCTSLTTAPEIPNSVTDMYRTFSGCTSLTTVPVIPNSVDRMEWTFENCTNLTGEIEINANPTSTTCCFFGTTKPIVLTGVSTKLSQLAATANKGNVTVQ